MVMHPSLGWYAQDPYARQPCVYRTTWHSIPTRHISNGLAFISPQAYTHPKLTPLSRVVLFHPTLGSQRSKSERSDGHKR
jgi:hypothetical protein